LYLGSQYATLSNRELQTRDLILEIGVGDYKAWLLRQDALAIGERRVARLRGDSDAFGLQAAFGPADAAGTKRFLVSYEGYRPSNLVLNNRISVATYIAADSNFLSFAVRGGKAPALQLLLGEIHNPTRSIGRIGAVAAEKTMYINDRMSAVTRARFALQSYDRPAGGSETQFRPTLHGMVSYRLTRGVALQGGLTIFAAGMPFYSEETTGLSTFLTYEPGGPGTSLRSKFVGYGTLRLVGEFRF
jgi:hypothetical protein